MADSTPAFADATAAAAAIRAGALSAEELTRHTLQRIERFNPALNAVVTLLPEQALRQARQADAQRSRGRTTGPLHGVPITIKDIYAVAGARTTQGLPALAGQVCPRDAVAVARLRAAGAIIIGLTNVPPGSTDWITRNPVFGQTNNPWDPARTPGGSSGGCAAALAAGLSYLSLGSDVAGSIRIPAHFCGIFGHKTSVGVIPLNGAFARPDPPPGAVDNFMHVAGSLARSAADLMTALKITGGPHGAEAAAYRWRLPPPRAAQLAGYRIGFVLDDPLCPVVPAVKERLATALTALADAGVALREGWPPGVDSQRQLAAYESLLNIDLHGDMDLQPAAALRRLRRQADGDYQALRAAQLLRPLRQHLAILRQRDALRAAWSRYFETCDAFVMPVTFTPAIAHDANRSGTIATAAGPRPYGDLLFWNAAAALSGLPATAAPIGLAGSLPVGLQVMAPYLEDATAIDIAGRITALLGGAPQPPPYW